MLLDTHAFLWWVNTSELLSPRAREAIGSAGPKSVYVSAVSAYEISLKQRLGKLPGAEDILNRFQPILGIEYFESLDVSVEDGIKAGQLPMIHRDPFDRLLIAQALLEDAWLVSNEELFDRYGVKRLW